MNFWVNNPFTHPHVIANLYDFLSFVRHKKVGHFKVCLSLDKLIKNALLTFYSPSWHICPLNLLHDVIFLFFFILQHHQLFRLWNRSISNHVRRKTWPIAWMTESALSSRPWAAHTNTAGMTALPVYALEGKVRSTVRYLYCNHYGWEALYGFRAMTIPYPIFGENDPSGNICQ